VRKQGPEVRFEQLPKSVLRRTDLVDAAASTIGNDGRSAVPRPHVRQCRLRFTSADAPRRSAAELLARHGLPSLAPTRAARPPGMWAQWDEREGPRIAGRRASLFCAWLAWSRHRMVIPTWDPTPPTLTWRLCRTVGRRWRRACPPCRSQRAAAKPPCGWRRPIWCPPTRTCSSWAELVDACERFVDSTKRMRPSVDALLIDGQAHPRAPLRCWSRRAALGGGRGALGAFPVPTDPGRRARFDL